MTMRVRISCDHPHGCVRFVELDHDDVAPGWYRQIRRDRTRRDLCPEHKNWKPGAM